MEPISKVIVKNAKFLIATTAKIQMKFNVLSVNQVSNYQPIKQNVPALLELEYQQ